MRGRPRDLRSPLRRRRNKGGVCDETPVVLIVRDCGGRGQTVDLCADRLLADAFAEQVVEDLADIHQARGACALELRDEVPQV